MNHERYNSCIKDCELLGIASDKINAEVFSRVDPSKNCNITISYKPHASYVEDSIIQSTLEAEIEGFPRANSKHPSWRIDVKVSAGFSMPHEDKKCLSEEELITFSSRQGLSILLPHLRSIVSHVASECGLGSIILPLVKFPAKNTTPELPAETAKD